MGAAVAVILIKERHIVEAFERAGATRAERAVVPEEIMVAQGGAAWRRLRSREILRESVPDSGTFYADSEAWQALRTMRRRRIALFGVVALTAAVAAAVASSR